MIYFVLAFKIKVLWMSQSNAPLLHGIKEIWAMLQGAKPKVWELFQRLPGANASKATPLCVPIGLRGKDTRNALGFLITASSFKTDALRAHPSLSVLQNIEILFMMKDRCLANQMMLWRPPS